MRRQVERSPSMIRWGVVEEFGDEADKVTFQSRKSIGLLSESESDKIVRKARLNKVLGDSTRELEEEEALDPDEPRQQWRKYFYRIIKNEIVQRFIVFLIIANGIMMGLATFSFVQDDPGVLKVFDLVDIILLYVFTVELGFNLIANGLAFFQDPWLLFDLGIILPSWAFPDVKIIRAFRIFRTLRLFGRVESLKRILIAIASTGSQMASISVILFIFFYIFAVMLTQLYRNCYEEGCYCEDDNWRECPDDLKGYDYFGRMDYTFYTLLIFMTMDDWNEIVVQTQRLYPLAWMPLCFFILVTAYVMVNLVIAVLCDAIQTLSEIKQKKEDEKSLLKRRESANASLFENRDKREGRSNSFMGSRESISLLAKDGLDLVKKTARERDDEMRGDIADISREISIIQKSLSHIEKSINRAVKYAAKNKRGESSNGIKKSNFRNIVSNNDDKEKYLESSERKSFGFDNDESYEDYLKLSTAGKYELNI